MTPETCRDVLADMLAAASNMSDLADALDSYGYPTDRIRAAIAADKQELETMASDQPSNLLALSDRLRQLSELVARQDFGGGEWTMRVPAEPHRDADLVLSSAATLVSEVHDLRNVRAELKAARGEIARLRRIEEAAREFVRRLAQSFEDHGPGLLRAEVPGRTSYEVSERLAVLRVALLPPTMRQLGEADAAAKEGNRG